MDPGRRQQIIKSSVLYGHYENVVDRESAYEVLKGRTGQAMQNASSQATPSSAPLPAQTTTAQTSQNSGWLSQLGGMLVGTGRRQGLAEAMAKSAVRAVGSQVGQQIVRGVLGSILGGTASRRRY